MHGAAVYAPATIGDMSFRDRRQRSRGKLAPAPQ